MARSIEQALPEKISGRLNTVLWQAAFIIAIIIAIAVCEYVFTYRNVTFGIIGALSLSLIIYFAVSVLNLDHGITRCAESLALIPLYILFTSSLPWFVIGQQYLLPMVYACIIGLCLWHVYQKKLDLREIFNFDKRKLLKYSLAGIAIGIPTGIIEYLVLQPAPAFPEFSLLYFFRDLAYMLVFVAVAEELLFRGLIQKDLADVFGWKWALFATSVLFAVMHLTWRSIPELGFVFVAGLIFGGLYLKTKSMTAPIVMHGINNVMLVAVAPYIFG